MADWDLHAFLLRRLDVLLQGANWQRAGGKGSKPKPVDLPDGKGRGSKPARTKASGEDIARRLHSMGLIPAGPT